MKKLFTCITFILSFAVFAVNAQDLKIPQPSTQQSIIQDFGLGQMTLTYSRPNVKGRKIFGYMEPYGIVWRNGANNASVLKLTDEVMIEGQKIPAGEYGFFSIPGEKEWTFILNKTPKQWGAYSYKESDDLVRFKVPRVITSKFTETLTMLFVNTTTSDCTLQLNWENTEVSLHFKTDVDARVMENIAKAMQGEKKPYYFAAIYYYNNNKDINKALEWINLHDKAQPNSFNVKYWKARILLKAGSKKEAIVAANEGLKIATDENNPEYIRLNKEVLAEANKS